jgi:hypothetical protein
VELLIIILVKVLKTFTLFNKTCGYEKLVGEYEYGYGDDLLPVGEYGAGYGYWFR